MAKKCSASNRDGKKCGAWVITGETKCPLHLDPKRAAKLGAKHGRKTLLLGDDDLAKAMAGILEASGRGLQWPK